MCRFFLSVKFATSLLTLLAGGWTREASISFTLLGFKYQLVWNSCWTKVRVAIFSLILKQKIYFGCNLSGSTAFLVVMFPLNLIAMFENQPWCFNKLVIWDFIQIKVNSCFLPQKIYKMKLISNLIGHMLSLGCFTQNINLSIYTCSTVLIHDIKGYTLYLFEKIKVRQKMTFLFLQT